MYDEEPPEGWRTCEICNRHVKDLLVHLRITHQVRDLDDFAAALEDKVKSLKRKRAFRAYVEELKAKMEKGEISASDYRRLITSWKA